MGCGASQPVNAAAPPVSKPAPSAPVTVQATAAAAAATSEAPQQPGSTQKQSDCAPPAQPSATPGTAAATPPGQSNADQSAAAAEQQQSADGGSADSLDATASAAGAPDAVAAGAAAKAQVRTGASGAAGATAAQDASGSGARGAAVPAGASQVVEDEEALLLMLQQQQEQQLKAIQQQKGAGGEGGAGGGGGAGAAAPDPDEIERVRKQQDEVQKRLEGLTPEQVQLLKLKLQQRLEQQLMDFNGRMRQQQEEALAEAAEEERRQAERARRKAEAEASRPARQAAYEQELLAAVLLPGKKPSDAATAAGGGAAAVGAGAGGLEGEGEAGTPRLPAIAVKAWTGDSGDDGLLFPETDDLDFKIAGFTRRAPVALCFAGGSGDGCAGAFHAAAAGLGWLRALHQLGLLGKAQYAAAGGGGGAWLLGPIWFHGGQQPGGGGGGAAGGGVGGGAGGQSQQQPQQQEALVELLGAPARPPEQCTPDALQAAGEGAGRSYLGLLAGAVGPLGGLAARQGAAAAAGGSDEAARAWTAGVSEALLAPWGLGAADCAVTSANTKGKVHESVAVRAASLGRTLLTANSGLPYPILCQSIVLPAAGDATSYYPYEWSPLYAGCPVTYSTTEPRLGGGWVEALGANAELVAKPATAAASGCEVRVRPRGPGSLADAVAVASLAAASGGAFGGSGGGGPPPHAGRAYFDHQGWETVGGGGGAGLRFTDGGCAAHTAVYPALRRRVKNLLVLITSRSGIADQGAFCAANRELSALFGRWPGAEEPGLPAADVYNKRYQVFDADAFGELHGALAAKAGAGQPTVFLGEYEVLANAHCGVPGGWAVRVLWVVASGEAAEVAGGSWAAALPAETRAAHLAAEAFPFAAGVLPRAGHEALPQLELTASRAAWQLLASKDLASELFEDADDDDDE
ncbi:hypothetical protein HXX76_006269 [Chlamydomonas incerta]|uniref:Uncharacterized protein n=1 Tax=Chlamydomonas incerta TaxID=51695 RepID=A0A835TF99_CHLIN|nr:hypothetical protein HXX76_006269 [Chlamydomonas incerta]|eukprot:KAG2436745.1 hypothetical protein HXX76_006269 [Chlamydomonas incerta]